uniref:Uncharacterized protein n=1 Tax=Cannabis sativa TaxID=3483 RepID=A0A803NNH6_CANSA
MFRVEAEELLGGTDILPTDFPMGNLLKDCTKAGYIYSRTKAMAKESVTIKQKLGRFKRNWLRRRRP